MSTSDMDSPIRAIPILSETTNRFIIIKCTVQQFPREVVTVSDKSTQPTARSQSLGTWRSVRGPTRETPTLAEVGVAIISPRSFGVTTGARRLDRNSGILQSVTGSAL